MVQDIEKNKEKSTAEDRISVFNEKKYEKIKNSNSQMYYLSFIVLNILALVISLVFLSNQKGIEDFSIFWSNVTYQGVLLLFGIFVAIMIMKTIPSFLKIYSQTKKIKFGLAYRSIVVGEYYSIVTMYSSGEKAMTSRYLTDYGIENKKSIDIVYSKSIFNRIAALLYSFVVFILGLILWMDESLGVWLILIAAVSLVINILIVAVVVLFNINKKYAISLVGNFVKLLYSLKIIKNYERTYNQIIDNLLIYNKSFKQNPVLIFTEIMAYLVVNFLKCILLYYSLIMLNIGGIEILGDIIFRYVIFDLIIAMWPLQKGSLIYEALFYAVFIRVFFSCYVCWGIIVLRIFEYLLYLLQYVSVKIYDSIMCKFVKKASI